MLITRYYPFPSWIYGEASIIDEIKECDDYDEKSGYNYDLFNFTDDDIETINQYLDTFNVVFNDELREQLYMFGHYFNAKIFIELPNRKVICPWIINNRNEEALQAYINNELPIGRFVKKNTIASVVINNNIDYYADICARYSLYPDAKVLYECAAKYNSIYTVKWLFRNCQQVNDFKPYTAIAVKYGNLEILKYLKKNNKFNFYHELFNIAGEYGHFNIIKWMASFACVPKLAMIKRAMKHDNIAIMSWLYMNFNTIFDCNDNHDEYFANIVAKHAAKTNKLHIIKWIHYEISPINSEVKSIIRNKGRGELYNWLCTID